MVFFSQCDPSLEVLMLEKAHSFLLYFKKESCRYNKFMCYFKMALYQSDLRNVTFKNIFCKLKFNLVSLCCSFFFSSESAPPLPQPQT